MKARLILEVKARRPEIVAITTIYDCIREAIELHPEKADMLKQLRVSTKNKRITEDFSFILKSAEIIAQDIELYIDVVKMVVASPFVFVAFKELVIPLIQKKLKLKEYYDPEESKKGVIE